MKKLILAVLLIVTSTSAMAEWTRINAGDNADDYVNYSSIRKTGNKVKMWTLRDWKTIHIIDGQKPYLSEANQFEYDCDAETYIILAWSNFSGSMGKGDVTESASFRSYVDPIYPDSIAERKWKIACGKK